MGKLDQVDWCSKFFHKYPLIFSRFLSICNSSIVYLCQCHLTSMSTFRLSLPQRWQPKMPSGICTEAWQEGKKKQRQQQPGHQASVQHDRLGLSLPYHSCTLHRTHRCNQGDNGQRMEEGVVASNEHAEDKDHDEDRRKKAAWNFRRKSQEPLLSLKQLPVQYAKGAHAEHEAQ